MNLALLIAARATVATWAKRRITSRISSSVAARFDTAFYCAGFAPDEVPEDPVLHYLEQGCAEGRDPCGWFSSAYYLATHQDVAAAGMNPFVHYILHGQEEGRRCAPPLKGSGALARQHHLMARPGPLHEALVPVASAPAVKAIAYYLPQFHACAENDAFWGQGFTDWTNVTRALPRFAGQLQPRLPQDLGFYDLSQGDIYRRQVALARAAGLHGFCFYYYAFAGRRVLDLPVERMLADRETDFPFALMWANENWTRTWDGGNREVLLEQDYSEASLAFVAADLARHLADPRYIRLDGRPLLIIYNPGSIPEGAMFLADLRQRLEQALGVTPLLYMAQTFGHDDPGPFGLDGAIQFPPHNLRTLPGDVMKAKPFGEGVYGGRVLHYKTAVKQYSGAPGDAFPLIRCCFPNWDNEPRRPDQGTVFYGSTPARFEGWARQCVSQALRHPVHGGEALIAVNAWNEWAEGAFLEPDLHFGHANLNALGRALTTAKPSVGPRPAVFAHLQKTAGSTVINMADQAYGADAVISHGDFLSRDLWQLDQYRFVSGHFGHDVTAALRQGRYAFTFLREPRERVVSHYYFMRRQPRGLWPIFGFAHDLDLEAFLALGLEPGHVVHHHIWNLQTVQLSHGWVCRGMTPRPDDGEPAALLTRAIAHLDLFDHVGLVETFDADIAHIFSALGARPPGAAPSNATPGRKQLHDMDPTVLNLLDRLTELDRRLYQAVLDRRLQGSLASLQV